MNNKLDEKRWVRQLARLETLMDVVYALAIWRFVPVSSPADGRRNALGVGSVDGRPTASADGHNRYGHRDHLLDTE